MEENTPSLNNEASQDVPQEVSQVLEELTPDERSLIIQAIKQETFRGSIQHPDILKGYEAIKEGFAERIVQMAEQEQESRIKVNETIVNGTLKANSRGQWMGFAIAVLFLGASVALALYGQSVVAGILGGGTIVSLVAIFVTNRHGASRTEDKHP